MHQKIPPECARKRWNIELCLQFMSKTNKNMRIKQMWYKDAANSVNSKPKSISK